MKNAGIAVLIVLLSMPSLWAQLTPTALTCEHRTDPLGIDVAQPRLSWQLTGTGRGLKQTAYELDVATTPSFSPKTRLWQSGRIGTDASVLQPYGGPALTSGQRAYWRVRTWDGSGKVGPWSPTAYWEMGLLSPTDWQAGSTRWITAPGDTARQQAGPAASLRREFVLNRKVVSARVYATARGLYELYLNGQRVGQDLLTPGWTAYDKRLQYQVYDVTTRLRPGANALGALLGEGWYRGIIGFNGQRDFYGNESALLAQLRIRYADGTEQIIGTGGDWQTSVNGAIRSSEIYNGEVYDARREQTGWAQPGFDARDWQPARPADYPVNTLIATVSQPVRRMEELKPVRIFRTPAGRLVADMGQNMTGFVRLRVSGPAGTTVKIQHAEILDKTGEFYTANLRTAKQLLQYTLKGGGEEVFEPHFTFMGFRYVAIEGWPGDLKPEHLTGVVIYTDMPKTGSFACSNPLVNQLQHNIEWGQKGNFVDVPTDCPQRDERLGWTGDAQAFVRTAGFNRDVAALFTRWLGDVAADQHADGAVPFVVPNVLQRDDPAKPGIATSAGWGDVSTIAPWTLYRLYGDRGLLERQYASMKRYVDHIRQKAGDNLLWHGGSVFGDWLFYHPHVNSHPEPDGYTSPDMIATAFFAYSTDLLQQAAQALGKTDDARQYADLLNRIKARFVNEYVTASGRLVSDSQTAYVLALNFNLLPEALRAKAAKFLVEDIRGRRNHLSTGFLGTPYLCHVLSDNGYTNVGYDLLLQESYPSWLYPVRMGATTIWERWDGMKPDSTFQDVGMNSFNHYAYGAIGDWMYRVVAGIELGQPGYRQILIQPQPTDRLTYARATLNSPYGEIRSGWERSNGQLHLRVQVPPNTTARIRLPGADVARVTEGGKPLAQRTEIKMLPAEAGAATVDVGSGEYDFAYPMP
ncbi:family 78 glycoside hydrolase catalytic domain [Spirosoma luteolum]